VVEAVEEDDPERARQQSLDRYAILDTPPEVTFDRITAVLARLLQVPCAIVTFIDRDRQWFKSRVGLDVEQTPRAISFCAHAILSSNVMVVRDTLLDERFAHNPLVTGPPHVRFYAGAPLITPEGVAVGTLAVVSPTPRGLSEEETIVLRHLADLVVTELEHRATGPVPPPSFCDDVRLSLVLDHIPAVIWTTDASLRITSTAGSAVASLSLPPDKLLGMTSAIGRPPSM
jgi:GAF domain-containing protein